MTLLCPCAPIWVAASGLFLLDSFMPFEVSICFIVAVHSPHPPTPGVCLSEWVRFPAPLIPFLVPSQGMKKYKHSREGSSWAWGSCSAYFEIPAIGRRWCRSQNVWQLFPSLHWTLAERGSQYDVVSLQNTAALLFAPPIPTPMFLQAATRFLRTPQPLLPILFRLKENPKGLGHNGGKWKSTVFSFSLSFLGLIFCFLVVLISAICNSYI